ncbi:hypothetical protein C1645_805736 [Glomus cerebriforme]|uniref:Uncharacterized protein n=1 Tax=Glomus cerebriforme TaxID=658196 RepID=A0A397SWT9_9GLOM|nr:hypothetical protein C1645_805736 [Glomus cerebriforme]
MGIDKANYGTVTGKLLIASFIEPKNSNDDACKINNLPLNEEISILVIPFQDAYDVGCRSYSDIIKSNNWEINQNNANNYNIPKNLPPETPNGAQPGGDNINNGLPNNNGAQIPPQQQNYGNPNNNNNINNIPNGKGFNDNNNVKNNDNVPNPPINQPKQIPPDNQLGQNPPPNNQQLPNNPNPPNNQPAPNAPNNQPNPNPIPNIPNVPVNIPNIPNVPVNIPNIPNVPVNIPNIPNVPVDVPKVTADGVPVNVPKVTADGVPVNVPSVTADSVPVNVPSVTDIVPVSVPTVTNINVPTATDIVPISVPSVTNIPAASQSSSSQTTANSPTATSSAPLVTANANVNTPVANANVSVGLRKRQEQYTPIPKVLVFSSMNGGEPGIKEIYSGDRDVLKGSIPGLTLLKYSDIAQLKKVNDQIDHGEISSGRGKWYNLVTSPSWVAWSIIMSIIYTIISIITIHKLISHYHNCGFSLKNVKYFCYPEIEWKKAASKICQTHNYHNHKMISFLMVEIETPTPNNNNKRLSMNAPPTPPTPLTPMTLTSMTSLLRNNLTTINELPKRNEMVIGTNRLSDYNNHNRNNSRSLSDGKKWPKVHMKVGNPPLSVVVVPLPG